jgi:glucokinase
MVATVAAHQGSTGAGARVIGVDVGGTKTLGAVVTRAGEIEARLERPAESSSQEALLASLDGLIEELRAGTDVAALGIGIPSRIDQWRGRSISAVNLPLEGVDLRDRMREEHGLPVGIENDANAAAIGEWKAGVARGASNVVMLTLGTGVGGGLIVDGRPFRGSTGSAAELGHIVIDVDGPPCPCGGHGHLESYACGPVADRIARELFGPEADAEDLVSRARESDTTAKDALGGIGRKLGAGIATFVNVFEPELVVVGGGFGAAGELLLEPAREVVAREGLEPGRDAVRIVEAELGVDAGVIGAAMIGFEALDGE